MHFMHILHEKKTRIMGHASLSMKCQAMSVFVFEEITQQFCYIFKGRTLLILSIQYKLCFTGDKVHSNGNAFSQ